MSLEALAERLPEYANDLKLNLSSVMRQTELTQQQAWGTLVTSAIVARNKDVVEAVLADAQSNLSPEALRGAKGAAAVMAMNNVYYRFWHLTENQKFRTIPARLRMNIIKSHGADPTDFELWCLAASAINACSTCVEAHEKTLKEKGISEETMLAAVRIASIVQAVATVLSAEG